VSEHRGGVALAPRAAPRSERHLLRAKDMIDARYRDPLDVALLACAAQMSQAPFSRAFRGAYGETPHQYLLTVGPFVPVQSGPLRAS
jgi:transcriptional regulator GlxA family with amidase domain